MDRTPKTKGWTRVLLFIVPYIFIVGLFQFIGLLISGTDYEDANVVKTSGQHAIISFFGLLGTFLIVWIFMKYVDREKFIKLGFQIKNRLKDINFGVILGFLIMGMGLIILLVFDQVEFLKIDLRYDEILLSLGTYIMVAITEETLFRGYIQRNLMGSFNSFTALMLSSLLFAFAHCANPNMDWFSFLDLFLAGVLLGISYVYTKNLWFPISFHFSWNFFQTLFGFNVSGLDFYSLIEFKITEKNILNGGDFGFEGSILSVLFQLLLILLVYFFYKHRLNESMNLFNSRHGRNMFF